MTSAGQRFTLVLSVLLGCAFSGLTSRGAQPVAGTPASTNAAAAASEVEYKLLPQDKLTFRIDEDPIKAGQAEPLIVSALGDIQFPVSRGYEERIVIRAKGRTLKDVEAEIKAKLEADFYKQATVHLRLVDQSRRVGQVQFFGMVRGPVELFPGEQKSLSSAILQLGYNEFANLRKVKIQRIDPVTKENKTIIVNVEEILKTNDRKKDIILQDGDRVEVPERGLIF